MTIPTGPTADYQCGFCQGAGQRIDTSIPSEPTIVCDRCHGTGNNTMTVHPFVNLEAAVEHVQAIRTCMRLQRTENFKPQPGTPAYHVDAVEDALNGLFQQLVVMLPDEYERTEGGVS